jgi:cytoskeletal protein CcmA (bactofilin family)
MVFRRDQRPEYQRQMGALRQQLGGTEPVAGITPSSDAAEDDASGGFDQPTYSASPRASYASAARGSDSSFGYGGGASPAIPTPPQLPNLPHADDATTVVSADTSLKGDIESKGGLHVYGRVEGSLTAVGEIFIAEGAEVDASIYAATVIVGGRVRGEITSSGRFELLPTGRVEGTVSSATLVVHDGGAITGAFRMRGVEAAAATDPRLTSVAPRRSARGSA